MEISEGIMSKVREKELYMIKLNRCLIVLICPKCGNDLKCHRSMAGRMYDNGSDLYKCSSSSCTFEYSK